MKKLILFIALLLVCSQSYGQNFTFQRLGPLEVQPVWNGTDTLTVLRQAVIKNNTANYYSFRFARIVNNLPAYWSTQMCYDLCYSSFTDTISPPHDPPYDLAPYQQDTLFYIDFTGFTQGTGTSIVRMYNTVTPSMYSQDTFKVKLQTTGITNINSVVSGYELSQNFPNPFNPSTTFTFSIPERDNVSLVVYDVHGREVASLLNNQLMPAGQYKYELNSGDYKMASGVYFYKLITSKFTSTKKMILLK